MKVDNRDMNCDTVSQLKSPCILLDPEEGHDLGDPVEKLWDLLLETSRAGLEKAVKALEPQIVDRLTDQVSMKRRGALMAYFGVDRPTKVFDLPGPGLQERVEANPPGPEVFESNEIVLPSAEEFPQPYLPPRVPAIGAKGYIKHVRCEGARFHVIRYGGTACVQCSEPDCIVNKPVDDPNPRHVLD